MIYDIGIVGGGPAGLSAAIWSARYLHSVVLVDSGDPRNWETRGVSGFLGLPHIRPPELRELGRQECRKYGVALVDVPVQRASKTPDDRFLLTLNEQRELQARRLLLSIGIRDVWPDIPGLERAYGANAHVCPDCDGYDTRGKKVVVIGNGRKAVGMALDLTTWTNEIIICTAGHAAELDDPAYCEKLDALNIPVILEPIERVVCEGSAIHSLLLANGLQLDADKVFFCIGQYPADDLGVQLGCRRDEADHIVVDEHFQTSVANVFAAGDIVPGPQLAIAAASGGAIAAMAMHKSLVPAARKLAKQEC